MRVYLDTSSIRKNSNVLINFKKGTVYTSVLAVFELLSGIKESDFYKRKKIIKNLLESSIAIDWETYKKKEYNVFKYAYDDIEGYVIKQMAEKVIDCESYKEYTEIKIYTDDDTYYTHESLEDFDENISKVGKAFSLIEKNVWSKLSKEERKNFKKNMERDDMLLPYIQLLSEISLTDLAEDISGHKRPDERYMNTIQKYDFSLDVYLKYSNLLFVLSKMNGSEYGKNDTIDVLHLVYLVEGDMFISEDNIFKKLNRYLQRLTIYNSKEYFEMES